MNDAAPTPPAPSRPRRRWVALVSVLLGIAAGLAIAELAFSARDHGAFPHLNLYVADEVQGVALEPMGEMRLAVGPNPITEIHVGADGFRGATLGPPGDDEMLVVGDSQVFGLGVNDDETFSAVLAARTGRTVINGGVPTYGPLEYTEVVRRVLARRHPHTVVYVVNMANDFFEHSRPNRERHAEWDHWAVRRETAPTEVTSFPGRDWLYRSSHAFFALRQLLHQGDDAVLAARELGLPSEGSLHDLVHEGGASAERHAEAEAAHHAALAEHEALLVRLGTAANEAEVRLEHAVTAVEEDRVAGAELDGLYGSEILLAAAGHPGDILSLEGDSEEGRTVVVTASLLNQALRLRRRWIASATEHDDEARRLLEAEEHAEAALESERARGIDAEHVPSVLEPRLLEIAALCREHGVELVVVALPLDVLVSPTEFAKYGATPVDMSPSRSLLTDLVETAERMGIRALDATDALAAAEPGAFLDGDLHMSPRGHAALADAIAARLSGPIPLAHPRSGLPEGRSRAPWADSYLHEPEANVRGSSAAHCVTHLIREWLRISCRDQPRVHPTGIDVVSGGHGEAMRAVNADTATLLVPLLRGDELVADFHWTDRTQRLTVRWPAEADAPDMAFGEALPAARPAREISSADERLCDCHREVMHYTTCRLDEYGYPEDCVPSCQEVFGEASPGCITAHATDCAGLLRCARGEPDALPTCPEGEAPALATGTCRALCRTSAPAVPCATGSCTPWQGGEVCLP